MYEQGIGSSPASTIKIESKNTCKTCVEDVCGLQGKWKARCLSINLLFIFLPNDSFDNDNYIVDLFFENEIGDLKAVSISILRIEGVIEHIIFMDMAITVIVAEKLGVTITNK
ncbi:unnamed protein product [Cuscuta europaea]|uniref:Uncharacterized protein n=1 Tax=Cuscuta europaea TaxID=41803 RepID=A0A9P1E271_CUSEU|nr:unnamed protein product [Cuscuta europaea]